MDKSCHAAVATTCGVNGTDCSLQVYVGASGDDRYGVAFDSGWMIQEINRFSVASLYDNSKEDVSWQDMVAKCQILSVHHICGTASAQRGMISTSTDILALTFWQRHCTVAMTQPPSVLQHLCSRWSPLSTTVNAASLW